MHKLERSHPPAVACLTSWDYRTHTWDDFTKTDEGLQCKKQVRLALLHMQGRLDITYDLDENATLFGVRRAYCESPIYSGGHIEHFCRKNQRKGFPALTFSWENLFLSCDARDHCGHFKDRAGADAYDAAALIKPDQEEPDDFFYFHSSGEVRIRHRPTMTDAERRRASETIRVFNLNCSTLRAARRNQLEKYAAEQIMSEIMLWDPELREEYIRGELESTRSEPYATVIRHFFEKLD